MGDRHRRFPSVPFVGRVQQSLYIYQWSKKHQFLHSLPETNISIYTLKIGLPNRKMHLNYNHQFLGAMLVFDQTTSVVVYSFFQSPSLLDPEQLSNVPFRFTHCSRIRVQTDLSSPTFWMTMTDTELNWKSSLQPVTWEDNRSWLKGNLLFFPTNP